MCHLLAVQVARPQEPHDLDRKKRPPAVPLRLDRKIGQTGPERGIALERRLDDIECRIRKLAPQGAKRRPERAERPRLVMRVSIGTGQFVATIGCAQGLRRA